MPAYTEPCGPALPPGSLPWQFPHRTIEPAFHPPANAPAAMFAFVPGASTGWNDGFAGFRTFAKSVWLAGCVVHEEGHLKQSWYSATGAVSVSDAATNVYPGAVPAGPFWTAMRLVPSSSVDAAGGGGTSAPVGRATCGLWQSSHSAWRWFRGVIAKSAGLDSSGPACRDLYVRVGCANTLFRSVRMSVVACAPS